MNMIKSGSAVTIKLADDNISEVNLVQVILPYWFNLYAAESVLK